MGGHKTDGSFVMAGKVYGIGVGPGDPELLTLKAHRILRQAKIVCYPAPDTGESFARSIVSDYLSEDQIEVPIVIPMRVERFPAKSVYDATAEILSGHLQAGDDVIVLCEGDPFFYGSFMYLFERLSMEFEIEVVPGISSLMAAASALQRPLAARNDVLSIVPGPLNQDRMRELIDTSEAVAVIKVGRHLAKIRDLIEDMGLMGQAGYLERLTLDNQRVMPLASVSEDSAPYFSIILIYKGAENWVVCSAMPHEDLAAGDGG